MEIKVFVEGIGFRVQGLEIKVFVEGIGFRVQGSRGGNFRVEDGRIREVSLYGERLRVWCSGFRVDS